MSHDGSTDVQRFQSFWHGGPLSPYELFCLKSFIDCGHGFDLYSYDLDLAVPAGVRLCDASALIDRSEVYVYQTEGFGKGSPSAFSNLFRSRLMVEKGGWWVDMDVVCLTSRLPAVTEYFVRQDADSINWSVMYFEPHHPVMQQCLDEVTGLGRSVKWGDGGPRLLTRVLEEQGLSDRARPPAECNPVHFTEAMDVLRPSRTAALTSRMDTSLFLHLWNSMLVWHGVSKARRPPQGSLLRQLVDQHPVDGWAGEYDEQTIERLHRWAVPPSWGSTGARLRSRVRALIRQSWNRLRRET
jgi:hypothetical protein